MTRRQSLGRIAPMLWMLILALTASAGHAGLNSTGRWTLKSDSTAVWGSLPAVHLVLTRGYGHHSQILWYNSHSLGTGTFYGGVYGWDPASTTAGADCSAYPASTFTALTPSTPTDNVFCSGHTVLADGKIVVTGGSESGETGIYESVLFDPNPRTWTDIGDMHEGRWYSTDTLLPDGRVLVSSGSTFVNLEQFGGRAVPDTGTVASDSLQILGLTLAGQWDPPAKPSGAVSGTTWPTKRDAHSAVFNPVNNEVTIFGGRDSTGAAMGDAWFVYRGDNSDDGPTYTSYAIAFGASPAPSARYRHSAIVPDDSSTVIFGGRDGGAAKNDTWILYLAALTPYYTWGWDSLHTTGSIPSARQGHGAVWDSENHQMLVFGGADASDGVVDSTLYALTLGGSPTWSTVSVDSDATYGRPCMRHGHVFLMDRSSRTTGQGAPDSNHDRRVLMFGGKRGTTLLNDLWVLWIPKPGTGAHYLWKKASPSGTPPSGRYRLAADLDLINERLVMAGGDVGGSASAETWTVNLDSMSTTGGSAWLQMASHPQRAYTGQTLSFGQLNWARTQETLDPGTGVWTLTGSKKKQDWYPFHFVAPQTDSLRVFAAGPDVQSYYLNLSASPAYWRPFPANPTPGFRGGSAVMYRPGKIMRAGSRDTDPQNATARGMTMKLDLQGSPTPTAWTQVDTMTTGRVNHNLVLLPSGDVFVTGGTNVISNATNQSPVFRPQIWRASSETYTSMTGADTLAADSTIRGYHSNAALLPDGRVLTLSGNPTDNDGNSQGFHDAIRATVFCPPYLFKADGSLRARPLISTVDKVSYGSTFTVCVDNSSPPTISSVCLIRPAASTHAFNMDQRYVPLSFVTSCRKSMLSVTAPANAYIAPPGDYMLFAVKSDSTPSIASWIRLGSEDDEFPPVCTLCGGGFATILGGDPESSTAPAEPENTLLTKSREGTFYEWKRPVESSGSELLTIAQEPGGETVMRDAKLVAVEHATDERIFATDRGFVAGALQPLAYGMSPRGRVEFSDGKGDQAAWVAAGDDTLDLDLAAANGGIPSSAGQILVVNVRRGVLDAPRDVDGRDVTLLEQDSRGVWTAAASAEARRNFDEIVFSGCPAHVRLALATQMQVRALGVVRVSASRPEPKDLERTLVTYSPQDAEPRDVSLASVAPVHLGSGDRLDMHWTPALPSTGRAVSYFLQVDSETKSKAVAGGVTSFAFAVEHAYPNPFSQQTAIHFVLPNPTRVRMRIYDVAGRLVRTLVDGKLPAGPGQVAWDGLTTSGAIARRGVYFARLEAAGRHAELKLIRLGR
jgi:hypothetical protein